MSRTTTLRGKKSLKKKRCGDVGRCCRLLPYIIPPRSTSSSSLPCTLIMYIHARNPKVLLSFHHHPPSSSAASTPRPARQPASPHARPSAAASSTCCLYYYRDLRLAGGGGGYLVWAVVGGGRREHTKGVNPLIRPPIHPHS